MGCINKQIKLDFYKSEYVLETVNCENLNWMSSMLAIPTIYWG